MLLKSFHVYANIYRKCMSIYESCCLIALVAKKSNYGFIIFDEFLLCSCTLIKRRHDSSASLV